jgi:hypothetical protein
MTFQQNGASVTGSFTAGSGTLSGTVTGNTLLFHWTQPDGQLGDARLTLASPTTAQGVICYGAGCRFGEAGTFTATRISGTGSMATGGPAPIGDPRIPSRITLIVNDGLHEYSIAMDRGTERITRSAGVDPLGSHGGAVDIKQGGSVRVSATLTDGSVPPGHRLRIYWQGFPRDEDVCSATSGAQCSASHAIHTLRQSPNHPIACAVLEYVSGGTNQGLGIPCLTLIPR